MTATLEDKRKIAAALRGYPKICVLAVGIDGETRLVYADEMAELLEPTCTEEDNLRLIDRNRDLDAENAALKQEVGRLKREHDHDADTTCSAYKMLSDEERETLRWVREHEGLREVSSSLAYGDELRARVLRILYGDGEAEHVGSSPFQIESELSKRLMPEDYEWPKYEDGEPVELGEQDSFEFYRKSITYWCGNSHEHLGYGERVKRPQVLDADGVPIKVGDEVWAVLLPGIVRLKCEVIGFANGMVHLHCDPDYAFQREPAQITHHRPELAADGEPIVKGQTMYVKDTGEKVEVLKLDSDSVLVDDGTHVGHELPEDLVHEMPVLDADGAPIHEGDTVWDIADGRKMTVTRAELDELGHVQTTQEGPSATVSIHHLRLTHADPDSWEKIEEDAAKGTVDYFKCDRKCAECSIPDEHGFSSGHYGKMAACSYAMKADLVRRCKKLAGAE